MAKGTPALDERTVFGAAARSSVSTVGRFGAVLLPFGDKHAGAAAINASLKTFAKPGTWFAPMWAIMVGAVAGGARWDALSLVKIVAAMALAGPLLCAFSQIVNDWCDRDVDRINEPDRPTAANLLAPRTIVLVAAGLALAALALAYALGTAVLAIAALGLVLALAYSVPPLRLKARNGWLANAACAFAYEGCAWVAGAAAFGHVTRGTLVLATLYSLGSHGLMTLNDFKSIDGDRRLGLRSIPAMLGIRGALMQAFAFIDVFQVLAIGYVLAHRAWIAAAFMLVLFAVQLPMQRRMARDPAALAPWYCASAIPPFVWGMLAAALAIRYGGF
ncbi:bacteriochlorophyll synthase 34 kDa chain [Vulcanimicrobium alpinum]|uniref:Bacteriochlorophyll synthase 34 kDa chain n=1 Tax=Vulcanimicrobium alpinum TaxID=3016050 RepID=A0AAN2CAG6_UNVUL|nr:chlorophyll synthase ChlG [Vulcanimicrobium alpinum]BDE07334.1 bacteriochlorophyll synthase 34 kDa chain [Vulcanimicrobium alpinum]